MKSTVVLSLALASVAVASPTKKGNCGGPHSNAPSYVAYPVDSSTSSSALPHATYSAASTYGTVCTTTSTAVESTTETAVETTTPAAVTTITTETETQTTTTTEDLIASTLTSTSTVFETNTQTDSVTETSTSTVLTTVTATPETTTVQPSPGFVPIQSKYPQQQANKRSPPAEVANARRGLDSDPVPSCTSTATELTTVTNTATATSTVEAPTPTSTGTETTTFTSTSTVLVTPASSTSTVLQTDQVTTTTTVTTTETATTTSTTTDFAGPTPTYYAACGPDNILSRYNGGNVDNTRFNSDSIQRYPGVGNGYDCCAACFADSNCYLSFYYQGVGCQKLTKRNGFTCDAATVQDSFRANSGTGISLEVYNSNCGQYSFRAS
ncbi:hypothetical protein MN608_09504 [Microdochium nivale]|nr:hypothetical protein MN608_09504 [Microdochium nivale]